MPNKLRDPEKIKPSRPLTSWGSTNSVFRKVLAFEIGLGFIALLLGWIAGIDVCRWLPRFETGYASSIVLSIVGGFVFAFPMLVGMNLLLGFKFRAIEEINQLEDTVDMKPLLELRIYETIAVSIAAGVGEELLLRGLLMGWLLRLEAPSHLVEA
jgi:hypothetical protein